MPWNSRWVEIAVGLCVGGWGQHQLANAQINPDATLPVNSIVTPQNNTFQIDGGTAAGTNLFHSFQEFSLPTGSEAFFNNSLTVENIITRVTGGHISNIDGLIRANGTANLFLLNPNGIVFGANARLDIGGSFLGSTADRVLFEDGSFFSATDTATTPPLLTINVPIGLQFGAQPGGIRVDGPGHNLRFEGSTGSLKNPEFFVRERPIGLQVLPNRTLALVGGEIVLQGGSLTATGDPRSSGDSTVPGGRIELGSVTGNNRVRLMSMETGWTLGYEEVQDFQDIQLRQKASLDVSGSRSGSIRVWGRSISVIQGSALLAWTLPGEIPLDRQLPHEQQENAISIQASELLAVRGSARVRNSAGEEESAHSRLLAEVAAGAQIDGGDITIQTNELRVLGGGIISAGTRGNADGGNLQITATKITLRGDESKVLAQALVGEGNGGEIRIDTDRLIVEDEGRISASTFSHGDAGNLTIHARESIEVSGGDSALRATSSVHSASEKERFVPSGDGGDVTIETDRLLVTNGASISTTTQTEGDAGDIEINAHRIEVSGADGDKPSQIAAQVNSRASGQGGEVNIDTDRLLVANGARIAVTTQGSGAAGELVIEADQIKLVGEESRLEARSEQQMNEPPPEGAPGGIRVEAERLFIRDGARILAENQGTNTSNIGNITIQVSDIRLRDGSAITARAGFDRLGNGLPIVSSGGNVTIEADTLLLENSTIDANAFQGMGGNVRITTQGLFPDFDSTISASSQLGINGIVAINTPDVDPRTGLLQLPETPIDVTTLIGQTPCAQGVESEFVDRGRGGLPPIPSEALRGEEVSVGLIDFPPDLESRTVEETQTPERVEEPPMRQFVEAQGWIIDPQGRVILTANPPTVTPHGSGERSSCRLP
jgi:filamentous hemagglutinin family protein